MRREPVIVDLLTVDEDEELAGDGLRVVVGVLSCETREKSFVFSCSCTHLPVCIIHSLFLKKYLIWVLRRENKNDFSNFYLYL